MQSRLNDVRYVQPFKLDKQQPIMQPSWQNPPLKLPWMLHEQQRRVKVDAGHVLHAAI